MIEPICHRVLVYLNSVLKTLLNVYFLYYIATCELETHDRYHDYFKSLEISELNIDYHAITYKCYRISNSPSLPVYVQRKDIFVYAFSETF